MCDLLWSDPDGKYPITQRLRVGHFLTEVLVIFSEDKLSINSIKITIYVLTLIINYAIHMCVSLICFDAYTGEYL